jgi:hypothetical protein
VTSTGIVDRRTVEPIDGPLLKHFATRKSVSDLEDGTTPAGKARRLAEAQQIALQGDITGRVDFDGSKSVVIQATLPDLGVVLGAYSKLVINARGRLSAARHCSRSTSPTWTGARSPAANRPPCRVRDH